MKKILIKLLMLVGIMCLFVLCNNTTSFGSELGGPIAKFLYGEQGYQYRVFEKYEYYSNNPNPKLYKYWQQGIHDLMIYLQNTGYVSIANNNRESELEWCNYILDGRLAMWYLDRIDETTLKNFKTVTGMDPGEKNKNISEYITKQGSAALRSLRAALHYKTKRTALPTINSTERELFQYNAANAQKYMDLYGKNNLNAFNKTRIINLWEYKISYAKKSPKDKLVTRSDIYVDINDSYQAKMSYDREQIMVYKFVWGDPYVKGDSSGEMAKGIKIEWTNMIDNGQHTDFYNKYYNGRSFTPPAGTYYSKENEKKYKEAGGDEKFQKSVDESKDSREDYELKDVNKDGASEAIKDKTVEKEDTDVGKVFHQPKNNTAASGGGITDVVNDAEKFVTPDGNTINYIKQDELSNFSDSIFNILFSIGVVVSVIVGLILGIKLMLAPVGERAEAKKLLVPYAIGCAVIFGAFGIWKLVVIILQSL